MASFLAYGLEKPSPKPDETAMGRGNARGIAALGACQQCCLHGLVCPLLTLGIPGSGTTAILLGAFIAYGIQPGPQLWHRNALAVLDCSDFHVYRELDSFYS